MRTPRSLPSRQPARAMVVLALYLVAVVAGSGLLQLRFSNALTALLAAMWAVALIVPLAIFAPRAVTHDDAADDPTPVLKRPRKTPPRRDPHP